MRFLAYRPNRGYSLHNTALEPTIQNAVEFVNSIKLGVSGVCPIEGLKDALTDGSLWSDEDQPILEELYNLLESIS